MAEAVLVGERAAPTKALEVVDTPNRKTIADVSNFLKSDPAHSVKALLVQGYCSRRRPSNTSSGIVLHVAMSELNEIS